MDDAKHRFIEHLGLMTQSEGAPRIAGQILGYLIVEGAPRTLQQMTEALSISKGSASTNARLLEFKGSVRRVSRMGQRQDAYEAVHDPGIQTLTGMAQRFRSHADAVSAMAAEFSEEDSDARERVERFSHFYRQSADFIDEWVARAEADFTAPSEQKD